MKTTVLAAALLAASASFAFAGESNVDAHALRLTGTPGTYVVGANGNAAPTAAAAIPGYAQTLPSNASMALVQTPNSLPAIPGASASRAAAPARPVPAYAQLRHDQSSMGLVQTTNSLPRGF